MGIEQDLYQAQERQRAEQQRAFLDEQARIHATHRAEQEREERRLAKQRARDDQLRAEDAAKKKRAQAEQELAREREQLQKKAAETQRADVSAKKRAQVEMQLAREAEALRKKAEKAGVSLPLAAPSDKQAATASRPNAAAFWFWAIVGFAAVYSLLHRWLPNINSNAHVAGSLVAGALIGQYWKPVVGLSLSALAIWGLLFGSR